MAQPSPSRIAQAFSRAREEGRAALVPYVTAGFPDRDATVRFLPLLADAGADVIELGVPFSDPLADGPTIQHSSFRALEAGMTVAGTLELLRGFRQHRDTAVVLFTYLNPVLRYGVDRFLTDAAAAGADGLLLTDLPWGADPDLERRIHDSPLDLIRLLSPTTPPERIESLGASGQGFLYYISRTGVTGARAELSETLEKEVRVLRERTDLPVAVGFGISSPEQARAVGRLADGVVVGSAVVQRMDAEGLDAAAAFVRSLGEALAGE